MNVDSHFLLVSQPQILTHGMDGSSIHLNQKHPHSCALRSISIEILNPIILAIKINHHTRDS